MRQVAPAIRLRRGCQSAHVLCEVPRCELSKGLWLDLTLDVRVLIFTIAVATATGVLFGLAPAWRATDVAPQSALRSGGRGLTDRHARLPLGKVLVVGQLALSLALVVGAGLLIGTLTRLLTIDTGFDRNGVLLATVNKRNAEFSTEAARAFDRELLTRIRMLPAVSSASASRVTPIGRSTWNDEVMVDGFSPANEADLTVYLNSTSDAYFATLGTRLIAGRDFDSRDAPGSVLVGLINETMALPIVSADDLGDAAVKIVKAVEEAA